ncbi:choice-of-anchor D domain-containing protein [Bacteroides sp. 214]|uniref:S8 family serine peptidase n=1 Tax=Bacteroides sp. 214 TaxID=2302935 RepID=UPI0013D68452|nr:S8 family serine peptidase [Bacteroides sp. 214]NDW13703.1 choice-of-anchor D domain-containing protein [Bacteroides sp. 214]
MKHFATQRIKMLLLFVLLCSVIKIEAQQSVYTDKGMQKGVVKVKFAPAMANTLNTMQVTTRSGRLSTGIQNLDKVNHSLNATNMKRLIPYNERIETKLRKHGLHLWYVIEIDNEIDPEEAIHALKRLGEVSTAEAQYEITLEPQKITPYTPPKKVSTRSTYPFNDPSLPDQWHYTNSVEGEADINLFEAWKHTAGRGDVIVAVLDQGIDVNHDDLKANMWVNLAELNGSPDTDDDGNGYIDDVYGYNFVDNRGSITPQSHGTHVAGTISAVNNNGIGVSGVAGGTGNNDGAKLMSLQILGGNAAVEQAFVYAATMGAVIAQNSWGYSEPDVPQSQALLDAIDYFIAEAGDYPGSPMRGGIVLFAAGNFNMDGNWYPQNYSSVLAVSSIQKDWKKAGYSNYGNWVDIAAPGGMMDISPREGVLSTLPNNKYGYMEGTSMSCPHVSGIAALAIANSDHQMTSQELRNKLLTGVIPIDSKNPTYAGMLGKGAVDAMLAIKRDARIAPDAITDLKVAGTAQEFVNLTWSVPGDEDDEYPHEYKLYYHTQPLTAANLTGAKVITFENVLGAGEEINRKVEGLLGLTTYYFVVTSSDRWGNISAISNVVNATTNQGPAISVSTGNDDHSIALALNGETSFVASETFDLVNGAEGFLMWDYYVRNSSATVDWEAYSALNYPQAPKTSASPMSVGRVPVTRVVEKVKAQSIMPMTFTSSMKYLTKYSHEGEYCIGEVDPSYPISGAAKFSITEEEGFNLTQVDMRIRFKPNTGSVILEIYKGNELKKDNLYYAQDITPKKKVWDDEKFMEVESDEDEELTGEFFYNAILKEQLYFEKGSTVWVVVHIPAYNQYPMGVGPEGDPSYSDLCFYSRNAGASWSPLSIATATSDMVWSYVLVSSNQHVAQYLTLNPESGEIAGNETKTITLNADGTQLINGSYGANIIFRSNDSKNAEYRMPVTVNVTGQLPKVVTPDIVNFGDVFIGSEKTLEIELDNQGYGKIGGMDAVATGDAFQVENTLWNGIDARNKKMIKATFKPTQAGNVNEKIQFSTYDGKYNFELVVFGVGIETSKAMLTPTEQAIGSLSIGDIVTAEIAIENQGKYPLKYFVPGFDTQGVSNNWPVSYHTYGYVVRTNMPDENDPLTYDFQDISGTGIDITDHFKTNNYKELAFGFGFPFYGKIEEKIYVSTMGFLTFSDDCQPLNVPALGKEEQPKGYISVLGEMFKYTQGGTIHYKQESDKLIVQFTDACMNDYEFYTAQIVLLANGDIRFYYEKLSDEFSNNYMSVLVEDIQKKDGIQVSSIDNPIGLFEQMAIGLDYPGPDIITAIENASGILMPGEQASVKVSMSTATLAEGAYKRFINFVTNDPEKSTTSSLVNLDVVSGGEFGITVSTEAIDFGAIYKDFEYSKEFSIRNTGSKNAVISDIEFKNNQFNITGTQTIKPGLNEPFVINAVTTAIATLDDVATITFDNGEKRTVSIKANVLPAPVASANLDYLSAELKLGETKVYPFEIENTGLSDLEYSVLGSTWFSFDNKSDAQPTSSYIYQTHNNGEPTFNWIDITKTGVHEDITYGNMREEYWHTLKELPFPIKFYGKEYTTLHLGESGILALGEKLPAARVDSEQIPFDDEGAYIMPLWSSGGFSSQHSEDITGLFYQLFEDKIVVSYNYYVNMLGMGDPLLAQAVIYKDGTIKFQYKPSSLDGYEYISRTAKIGLQNGKDEYLIISSDSELPHNKGLAYLLLPSEKRILPAGEKAEGDLILDASKVYAGAYFGELQIHSNDPANPVQYKPLELIVAGEENFSMPEEVDFGRQEVYKIDDWTYFDFTIEMTMRNKGDVPVVITKAKMEKGDQFLTQLLFKKENSTWTDIADLYTDGGGWPWPGFPGFPGGGGDAPEYTILPGDTLLSIIQFKPEYDGVFEDNLVLTTSLGEKTITLKGEAFLPPVINIELADEEAIDVLMNLPTEKSKHTILFDNKAGASDLNYEINLEYWRNNSDKDPLNNLLASATGRKVESTPLPAGTTIKEKFATTTQNDVTRADNFNSTIKYVTDEIISGATEIYALGYYKGREDQSIATRFTAGPDGFNVSDVGTWFMPGDVNGVIRVQVKAGGTSIYDALPVATGSLEFIGSEAGQLGKIYNVTLDNEAVIYPNENFYVIFTYPYGIAQPQVAIMDERIEIVRDRYLLEYHDVSSGQQEEIWYDFQEVELGYPLGWVMYAAEKSAVKSGWAKLIGTLTGTLAVGEDSKVEVELNGEAAIQGTQNAYVTFKSNDTKRPYLSVPVALTMNEGPTFTDAPATIYVVEKETREVTIQVADKEGNTFSVETTQKVNFVTDSYTNGIVKLVITPDYGDAGVHTIILKATDEYGASTECSINIEVGRTNRPPVYTGESTLVYSLGSKDANEYNIADLANDPDGDNFAYNIVSQDESIAKVYVSPSTFVVAPVASGETKLTLTLKDAYNATSNTDIDVLVESCLNPEGIIVQKWNSLLYVNNSGKKYKDDGYQWYMNGFPIGGATKQYYSAGSKEDDELDFTAEYHARMVTTDGKTVYTCPITPVRKDISLSVYPNTLKSNEAFTFRAELPDIKSSPITIKVINISGQVLKTEITSEEYTTIQMPYEEGFYLVHVISNDITRTFNITVE